MKKQALQINTWAKNVYVKIPVSNSKGKFMGKIIKELNNKNIKLNITAVYSALQTKNIRSNKQEIKGNYIYIRWKSRRYRKRSCSRIQEKYFFLQKNSKM